MGHTRIAVIGNGLALEIVAELAARERDLRIVGMLGLTDGPLSARTLSGAHVVVTSLGAATHSSVSHLLAEHPHLRVLAVSADGGESFLYELRPHEHRLGEISEETLLAAIRGDLSSDAGSA